MKLVSKLLLVMLLAALSACATLPSPEEMKASVKDYQLPKLPEDGKAIVYMVRPSALGGIVRFNVFVNDKQADSEMGYTRGNQYIYFNLEPGDHTILSKAENWAETKVSANAGDIIFIQQNPSMGIIMARNSLTIPPEYEGKYQVKNLGVGTIIKENL